MKILVIGSNGQLGKDVVIHCKKADHEVVETDFPSIDIASTQSVNNIVLGCAPEAIINCAAFTAVDNCENQSDIAYAVNAIGPENIANSADNVGAKLIHISTDYVFDGNSNTSYVETDETHPLTIYGKSKLDGETRIAKVMERYQIYRIAWLYGRFGNNFVKTIINYAPKKIQNHEPFKVVHDQFGTPTSTVEVCRQIITMLDKELFGVFHATCEGFCTWYDFTCEIVKLYNLDVEVLPCTTDEFPRPAPRPHFSVLENARLKNYNINVMTDWKNAFYKFYKSDKTK